MITFQIKDKHFNDITNNNKNTKIIRKSIVNPFSKFQIPYKYQCKFPNGEMKIHLQSYSTKRANIRNAIRKKI